LPKVHAVMEQLGGSIRYVEGPEGGAVFRMLIPLSPLVEVPADSTAGD
jgi:hypothetical protein